MLSTMEFIGRVRRRPSLTAAPRATSAPVTHRDAPGQQPSGSVLDASRERVRAVAPRQPHSRARSRRADAAGSRRSGASASAASLPPPTFGERIPRARLLARRPRRRPGCSRCSSGCILGWAKPVRLVGARGFRHGCRGQGVSSPLERAPRCQSAQRHAFNSTAPAHGSRVPHRRLRRPLDSQSAS